MIVQETCVSPTVPTYSPVTKTIYEQDSVTRRELDQDPNAELDAVPTNVRRQIAQVGGVLWGLHPQGKDIITLRLDDSIPSRDRMTLDFCHRVQVRESHVVYTWVSHDPRNNG